MQTSRARFDHAEVCVTCWLARYSITLLRIGLGVVFLGFGLLKFFPGLSPVEDLVANIVGVLTFGTISASAGIVLVAALECAIGLGLIAGKFMRFTLLLLAFQMLGAVSSLFFSPASSSPAPSTRLPWRPNTSSKTWCWSARSW